MISIGIDWIGNGKPVVRAGTPCSCGCGTVGKTAMLSGFVALKAVQSKSTLALIHNATETPGLKELSK